MKAVLEQHGFVVPQFVWITVVLAAAMFLLTDFVPADAVVNGELAKARNAQTGVRLIAAKSSLYYANTARQPESIADLLSNNRQLSGWKGPYISVQQSKDAWGRDYIIRTPGLHSELDVISLGADGLVGGVDANADIGNWESK